MTSKADLAKAGTMDLTAQDGKAYLEKNLTEWKKPGLLAHFDDTQGSSAQKKKGAKAKSGAKGKKVATEKKAAMKKAGTMAATAKEGNDILGGEKLGDTRQMTKQKKAPPKAAAKRATTMAKTTAEATAIYGNLASTTGGRKRKSTVSAGASPVKVAKKAKKTKPKAKPSPKKPKKSPMKKARTMVNTAKEGQEFLKRKSKK